MWYHAEKAENAHCSQPFVVVANDRQKKSGQQPKPTCLSRGKGDWPLFLRLGVEVVAWLIGVGLLVEVSQVDQFHQGVGLGVPHDLTQGAS